MRRIAAMIQAFIQLRELLDALDPLVQALQGARCQLLCALRDMCSADALSQLLARLDGLLDEDVHSARSAFLNRTQQCFALRAGVNHMLDVCRQAFCKTTEAVHEHAAQLRETHDLPALKVQYTARRGFYLFVPGSGGVNSADNEDGQTRSKGRKRGAPAPRNAHDPQGARLRLPSSLTVLNTSARGAQCTTDELNALNARLQDAGDDCLRLTEETLDGVSLEILDEHLGTLHRLIDGLALLDMLAGFARRLEATGLKYVRPTLTESGPLALVECRHPVLELAEGRVTGGIFRPNDAWIAIDSSLHVITGPNMSGKSTYLRQVALAVVMAQVGCHVPATFASLCPVDRIFTRMGTADSLESGSSSFMVEMEVRARI